MKNQLVITFTKFTSVGNLSKQFQVFEQKIVKEPTQAMSKGRAELVTMPFSDFADALITAQSNQAFAYGLFPESFNSEVKIAVSGKEDPENNVLARTKAYFTYAEGPGVVMLDHDPNQNGQSYKPEAVMEILITIFPCIQQAARISRGSVSAGVSLAGEDTNVKGFHLYFPVKNACDIQRFGKVLNDRLWLAGLGFISLAANGACLERTILDASVYSPERLDFVGQPVLLDDALIYTPPTINFEKGEILDTSQLSDLTEMEIESVNRLKDEAKKLAKSESDIKREEWKKQKIEQILKQGFTQELATKTLNRILQSNCRDLFGNYVLEFAGELGLVSVADVLKNPKKYEGKALADPVEGRSYGNTTAKFYWNNGEKPVINSFAHGGCSYFLHEDIDDLIVIEAQSMELGFSRDEFGKIYATLGNLVLVLGNPDFIGFYLGFDEFIDMIMFHRGDNQWQTFGDEHYIELRILLPRLGFKEIRRELMRDAVHRTAIFNRFDSAKDWLNSLRWDGIPRIETFFINYFGAEDTPYARAVGLYTFTALAERVLNPGCQADMVPILVGEQGIGKSTGIKSMVPSPEHYCEIDFTDKDDNNSRKMRGTLIGELGELRGLHTKDLESIKAFITRTCEKWTPKFKEFTTVFARRLIFIGTTNQTEFLADDTGNRRFLPLTVSKVDRQAITRDRNQLWAEAAIKLMVDGIMWQDAERLARTEFEKYEICEPWENTISEWLKPENQLQNLESEDPEKSLSFTTDEILMNCLKIEPKFCNRIHKLKVSRVMRKLGYEIKQLRRNGKKIYVWIKC